MSSISHEKYDSALMGILQHEGKCDKFLDVIFGFLMRRTDFFYIMSEDNKKLGYPQGVAVQMVLQAYKRYEDIFRAHQKRLQNNSENSTKKAVQEVTNNEPPSVRENVEIVDSSKQNVEPTTSQSQNTIPSTSSSSPPIKTETLSNPPESGPENYMADPECYNGAVRDTYTWSQSIKEVDLRIKVPEHILKGKDVQVTISKKHLKVSARSIEGDFVSVLDNDLTWEVVKDDCIWTLLPKEHVVHVSLEKVQERWWEGVLEGEDKINTRTIDCSRPMHELDEEAQAKIQQLMYDQEQKRLGKPTSQQQNVESILRKAWDAEGSPFKGQLFDPSKLNLTDDGSVTINPDAGPPLQ